MARVLATRIAQVTFTLAQLPIQERSADWGVRAAIAALRELTYRFTQTKSKPEVSTLALKRVVFSVNTGDEKRRSSPRSRLTRLANGMDLTRRPRQPAGQHLHADLPRQHRKGNSRKTGK